MVTYPGGMEPLRQIHMLRGASRTACGRSGNCGQTGGVAVLQFAANPGRMSGRIAV